MAAQRAAFLRWRQRQRPDRLVFLDEAGANLAMGRSHVWVPRGEEYVEPRPMNWGDNLTLVGAIRQDGWVLLNTKWRAMNKRAFVAWVRDRLAPRLRRGDIEPAWSLVKKRIRDYAPRTGAELRRVARATRHVVTPYHCRQYFAHAGYGHSTGNRD